MASKSADTPKVSSRMKMSAPPRPRPILKPVRDRPTLDLIMGAISSIDLTKTTAWSDLTVLSDRTRVDAIDAVPGGVFTEAESGFAAIATVYVNLEYGGKKDAVIASESFPAEVHGHFENGAAVIDTVSVNTSSLQA
jgi:Predicted pPIWI-associating nuclease